ncbi:hypothetical protein Bca52824_091072 [Brassica carinata]|uniref:NAC domain-containing protein n=1 Tax=Brassica carinata TaxID=52824 RepID=A0A8X7NV30_BRACI|nr:hypothetical protein Bca52824_091072 [Brassica carinata]
MNKSNPAGSVTGSDIIDAKIEEHQLCGSKKCPSCGHKLEGKPNWVGLPAGVKFDPTDQELIEHLEAKVFVKDNKSHPLIDEFIPTIEGEDGICYTHPEKLPGVTRDGLSRHFFHRPSKAYTTGTRKRRKIQTECDSNNMHGSGSSGETRWHKTGKTRPVMVNGKQKGCKKILVLYTNFGKNRKPEKTNWVMHQYHLGTHEEEREGELVVSKIFYQTQPRQCNWSSSTSSLNAIGGGGGEANSGGGGEYNMRRDSGTTSGGSCSSSREIVNVNPQNRSEEVCGVGGGVGGGVMAVAAAAAAVAAGLPSYAMDQLSFVPFMKSFDEVARRETLQTEQATCEDVMAEQLRHRHQESPSSTSHHHHHHHHQQHQRYHAFNISQPTHPMSTIISPSTSLHHAPINILDDNPYHVHRILLLMKTQQQQDQKRDEQHNDGKMGGRSASGLEELIMGCSSSNTHHDVKDGSSSMGNQQEAEWLKYSTTFWPAPDSSDNQDHHR